MQNALSEKDISKSGGTLVSIEGPSENVHNRGV